MHMRVTIAAIGILALTACGGETPAAGTDAGGTQAAAPVARDSCKDIATLAAAMNEPEPFTSVRTGNVMLGETKIEGSFTTDISPAGAACKLGTMDGFGQDAGKMYVANCELFSSGMFDREENGAKAKEIFDKAKAELDSCLPPGWSSRDGGNNGIETNESLIYETAADIEREKASSTYVYPISLGKEWSDGGMRGRPSGWIVTLNFQKETPKADTPAEGEATPAQ